MANNDSIGQAQEVKFKNDLKEVITALDVYQQRVLIRGTPDYDRDKLEWDGESDRTINSAKIENGVDEDKIRYILTGEVPVTLKGKIIIKEGKILFNREYTIERDWALELYPNIELYPSMEE